MSSLYRPLFSRFRRLSFFPAFAVLLAFLSLCAARAADLNPLILAQIKTMPKGGQYSASHAATARLQAAIRIENGDFRIAAQSASPSYCSGATYLVFLKTLEALCRQGTLHLDPGVLNALPVRGQPDGTGIWGRWNANGPGTARLFHELGLGRNFDDFNEARPGDFMKIFWSKEVGRLERGHSVIYLGREINGGEEYIRFWSSNIPAGYGEKTVRRSKVAYAIFSRLERPEGLDRLQTLAHADPYLASLLSTRSSISEARAKSGY